jgi:hypothetical protein
MRQVVAACLLVAMAFAGEVTAEIARQSKEELQAGSTDIVLGKVNAISAKETKDGQWRKAVGAVEVRITKVEKGDKLAAGELLHGRYWTQRWIGKGNPPPFGSGHYVPNQGAEVRVYLKRNGSGYDILLPNGVEVIGKAKEANETP